MFSMGRGFARLRPNDTTVISKFEIWRTAANQEIWLSRAKRIAAARTRGNPSNNLISRFDYLISEPRGLPRETLSVWRKAVKVFARLEWPAESGPATTHRAQPICRATPSEECSGRPSGSVRLQFPLMVLAVEAWPVRKPPRRPLKWPSVSAALWTRPSLA